MSFEQTLKDRYSDLRSKFRNFSGLRRDGGRPIPIQSVEQSQKVPITAATVANTYAELGRHPKVSDIVAEAVAYYKIERAELISRRREHRIAHVRHVIMYLARELTPYSYPHIGRVLGGRDHTTILHGVRKIQGILPNNKELAADLEALQARIMTRAQDEFASKSRQAFALSEQVREVFIAEMMRDF